MGVDPGTLVTGFGLIKVDARQAMKALDYGCIKPPSSQKLSDRYLIIHNDIERLIAMYEPDIVVVETQYVHKNVQSAIKLGMARGIVIVAARKGGAKVVEYSPTKAKKAVCHGRASKHQVKSMVQHLLQLPHLPEPEDAADALALAICHANALKENRIIGQEV